MGAGQVPQVTCHQNRAPWNLPQLSKMLSQNGYYTAIAGHYESNRNLTRGWHEAVSSDESGPLRFSLDREGACGSREVAWSAGTTPFDLEQSNSYLLTERVLRLLDGIGASGAPFFLHIAYNEPHPPYFVSSPYDVLVDPASLELPEQDGDERPPWQFQALQECGTEKISESDLRKLLAICYGMIAHADGQMRRVYEALAERGMLENTWIIIGSDHGDYAGEKGLFCKTESLYECLLHVSLIVCPPGSGAGMGGMRVDSLVDLVDLFPTILGIAGIDVPDYAQGYNFLPWACEGGEIPPRDCVYA